MKLSLIAESEDQAAAIKAAVQRFSDPTAVQGMVQKLGARDINDLIAKLESSPQVRKVLDAYREAKAKQGQQTQTESLIGSAGRALLGVVKAGLGTVAHTIGRILTPFKGDYEAPVVAKMTYAGFLLMTAALSGLLVSAGAAAPAAVPWGLLWFGWNFIEPMVAGHDRVRR